VTTLPSVFHIGGFCEFGDRSIE